MNKIDDNKIWLFCFRNIFLIDEYDWQIIKPHWAWQKELKEKSVWGIDALFCNTLNKYSQNIKYNFIISSKKGIQRKGSYFPACVAQQ
jgi:hypothetical protein